MSDPEQTLALAEELARGAGELLLERYGRLGRADADRKENRRRDLVSQADRDAEHWLVERIPEGDDILAEEGSDRVRGRRRRWIVDPLDGTVNYLHGIPFWSVSVAVQEDDRVIAAVVHAPVLRQTFTAAVAGGCHLNGEPVGVSSTRTVSESLLATGFAYARDEVEDDNLDNWHRLALESAGLRRLGSAAIDLAYTASGRLDGFWELHLNAWDVAAGILLVREAGGRVTDFGGREDLDRLLDSGHIVATNGAVHEALRSRLAPLRALD